MACRFCISRIYPFLSAATARAAFSSPRSAIHRPAGCSLPCRTTGNIAPNVDATIEPTEYQKRGVDLSGELRYLTSAQHGDFAFDFLPDDRLDNGEDRSYVKLRHVAELPDGVRLTINAENVSDPQYFEDFSQGTAATSTAFLERTARLSYRDENWRLSGELQEFQTLVPTYILTDYQRPYAEVPRLVVTATSPGDRQNSCATVSIRSSSISRARSARRGGALISCRRRRSISARPVTSCDPECLALHAVRAERYPVSRSPQQALDHALSNR